MSRDYCQSMSAVIALGDILVPRYQEFAIPHSQRQKKRFFLRSLELKDIKTYIT